MILNEHGWYESEHTYKNRRILIKSKEGKGMKAVVHYNGVHEFTLRFVFIDPKKLLTKTKNKIDKHDRLYEAWAYCDYKDKSTGFMIAYMQSIEGVNHNYVINFLTKYSKHRPSWYKYNQGWHKKYE